jgi:hypothetical protein
MLMLKLMCVRNVLMLKEVLWTGGWLLGGWRKCVCLNETGRNAGIECKTMRAQGWLSCGLHKKHYNGVVSRDVVENYVKKI